MTAALPVRTLLGPQRPTTNIAEAIAELPDGPLAVISAGWQDAEDDLDDVREIVGRSLEDLRLSHRAVEVFKANAHLAAEHRARQDRLKDQQRLYRLRLKQLAIAAKQTLAAEGDAEMLAAEQRHAIAQLRALDRHHLHRTDSIHRGFDNAFNTATNPLLARHAEEIGNILALCSAVLITGGHIAVLLNRMRLFRVGEMLADRPVVAWSAGAMVLAERIVLFHDRAPQGRRDPELLGAGCGLVPGYVLLPDTKQRLRQGDHARIGLMCRRFAPDVCVALNSGSLMQVGGADVLRADATKRLSRAGRFVKLSAA